MKELIKYMHEEIEEAGLCKAFLSRKLLSEGLAEAEVAFLNGYESAMYDVKEKIKRLNNKDD